MFNDHVSLNPRTPEKQRASSVFISPSHATGPRVLIGDPGRSKFGASAASASPSPTSRATPSGRAGCVDIKPSVSELAWNARAGSVASSVSPSESASCVAPKASSTVSRAPSFGRASSMVSRASSSRTPFYNRAKSVARAPSRFPAAGPLFSSTDEDDDDDEVTCLSPRCSHGDDDDVNDNETILAQPGGKNLPAKGKGSPTGSKKSAPASVDTPKFKPHGQGFDSDDLGMIFNEFYVRVFSDPSMSEMVKQMTEKYGFRSTLDLQTVFSQGARRIVDSNEGKFLTTSMIDPRKSYPEIAKPSNDPLSVISLD